MSIMPDWLDFVLVSTTSVNVILWLYLGWADFVCSPFKGYNRFLDLFLHILLPFAFGCTVLLIIS
jgi:hypothetical protein